MRNKVTWAGPNCTTHNHLYFHSFSLVFYGLMTVSFIQLFFCIRNDTQFSQKRAMVSARAHGRIWSGGRRRADRRPLPSAFEKSSIRRPPPYQDGRPRPATPGQRIEQRLSITIQSWIYSSKEKISFQSLSNNCTKVSLCFNCGKTD